MLYNLFENRDFVSVFAVALLAEGVDRNVGWLLEHKYIYRDQKNKLMPYAAKNNGLFEVKERTGRHNDWAGTQTLITPKGRETFRLLCKEPPVLPQFTAL